MSRRKNTEKSDSSSSTLLFRLYTLAFHAGLLGLLFAAGRWGLVITWVAAMIIVFPLFATIRQLMEHRDIAASGKIDYSKIDHGKVNRLFGNGPLDSSFGAAGFNKHLLHHWDPSISYTCLNEVEKFLTNCPETSAIIHKSKTSYLKTFVALFKI
jgi:fatty acid desaturase